MISLTPHSEFKCGNFQAGKTISINRSLKRTLQSFRYLGGTTLSLLFCLKTKQKLFQILSKHTKGNDGPWDFSLGTFNAGMDSHCLDFLTLSSLSTFAFKKNIGRTT